MEARYTLVDLLGVSPALAALKQQVRQVARGAATVLLAGETGTGKELLAHALHNASPRRRGPFVRVNCAAIVPELMEAEFFGYAPGAFTGALRDGRPGKFELAQGGTLFLDEVSELPFGLQAKLLRALQEKEVERVGGTRPRRLDVRVVAATNQDLEARVAAGLFRPDLYWRLNVITLRVPALRERPEDIIPLAGHFLAAAAAELGVPAPALTPAAAAALLAHPWPGNVRELESAMVRAMHLGCGPRLEPAHLPTGLAAGTAPHRAGALRAARQSAERAAIAGALARSGGNKTHAARSLGLSRSQFYAKLKGL